MIRPSVFPVALCLLFLRRPRPRSHHFKDISICLNTIFIAFLIWASLGQSGHPRCLGQHVYRFPKLEKPARTTSQRTPCNTVRGHTPPETFQHYHRCEQKMIRPSVFPVALCLLFLRRPRPRCPHFNDISICLNNNFKKIQVCSEMF